MKYPVLGNLREYFERIVRIVRLLGSCVQGRSTMPLVPISTTLALVVVILVTMRSVRCQPSTVHYPPPNTRRIETFFFGVLNLDELLLNPAHPALDFFDQICEQPFDSNGHVSGAYNPGTGEFKTWADYLATEGQHSNPNVFYAAHGMWNTFRGKCFWSPHNTSISDGPRTESPHWRNARLIRTSQRKVGFDYDDPGFVAQTSVPSWTARCSNHRSMASLFQGMPGIETIKTVWAGLRYPIPRTRYYGPEFVKIGPCHVYHFTVTRVVRTVRLVRVLFVTAWFYNNGVGAVEGEGWMDMGPQCQYVGSFSAWIDGSGLEMQAPDRTVTVASYLNLEPHHDKLPIHECL